MNDELKEIQSDPPNICPYGEICEIKCATCTPFTCARYLAYTHIKTRLPQITAGKNAFTPGVHAICVKGRKSFNSALAYVMAYSEARGVKIRYISADTAIYEKMNNAITLDIHSVVVITIFKPYPDPMVGVIDAYANIVRDKTSQPVWIFFKSYKITKPDNWIME
jgi:hypothetical protein